MTTLPLTVKELAYELGVSDHYVYQMHALGFPMERRIYPESKVPYLTATESDAREWIEANGFRLVDGFGVVGGHQFRFKLQADFVTDSQMSVKQLHGQIAA